MGYLNEILCNNSYKTELDEQKHWKDIVSQDFKAMVVLMKQKENSAPIVKEMAPNLLRET